MGDVRVAGAGLGQGGTTARAGGAHPGETDDGHTHESACLNCGTPLVGPHCHACGQAAHVHRTLAAFFHDLLHGVLHFEGKVWHTLPLLAWRPGRLTRDYIDGKRARHVSPIALFLFTVFVTYALFNLIGEAVEFDPRVSGPAARAEMAAAESRAGAEIAELERERAAALAAGRRVEALDGRIAAARKERELLDRLAAGDVPDTIASGGQRSQRLVAAINAAWRKARDNPALLVYKLQSNAYKYSWLLIPISVPFLWLLFPFSRRFGIYDHTVFVTYSLSFMNVLLMLASLAAFWNVGLLVTLCVLYAPFHMYRQLRGAYALGRGAALWRTAALLLFASIAIALFAAALIAMVVGG